MWLYGFTADFGIPISPGTNIPGGSGPVSWLNYSFRLMQFPIGVFGVAVGTVATTGLARRAAVGDMFRVSQDRGALPLRAAARE